MVSNTCSIYIIAHTSANCCKVAQCSTQPGLCHPPAANYFVSHGISAFKHPICIKVSIQCRNIENYNHLQFCNAWDTEVWGSCSLMRVGWEGQKELIFSVTCCLRSWRSTNIEELGRKLSNIRVCPSISGRGIYSARAEESFKPFSLFGLHHGGNLTVWSTAMNFPET